MTLDDLNNIDFTDLGSAPAAVRYVIILIVAVVIIIGGYYLIISDQNIELETHQTKEKELRKTFETRAKKAANLEAYKQQLAQMKESFGTMLKQLPSKTEVAELLVDISQTGLASGLEFKTFKPQAERPLDFYAELPISITVTGTYSELGEFVSGVAALPRIVTLHNFSIKPIGKSDKLTMSLTAKTYRYLDEK